LTIENSGIDLSNDQKKQIFKRFYKSSANSSSVGLGLNIVDSICKSNNYKLEYFNENGKHKFIIHF
jgi:K+-sensing histidine kinase KdpD